MLRLTFAVLVVSLVGCSSRTPCAPEDVRTVAERCRAVPASAPTFRVCRDAGLRGPDGFSFLDTDVAACSREGQGALFACIASRASECGPDGGLVDFTALQALETACRPRSSSSAPPDLACTSTCQDERRGCESACPTTDWATCTRCDEACSARLGTCLERC
jgi:hypothetical protein